MHDEAAEERDEGGECALCFEEGKTVCIVPRGHRLLYGWCGEEGRLDGRKRRPSSECPVRREEMCEPYAMLASDLTALM